MLLGGFNAGLRWQKGDNETLESTAATGTTERTLQTRASLQTWIFLISPAFPVSLPLVGRKPTIHFSHGIQIEL